MTDLKILIADDLTLIRSLIIRSLHELKIENIAEAEDGMEAIEKLEESKKSGHPFDVVFIDWNMPRTTGLDVVKHCQADPSLKHVHFIMVSAERDKVRVVEALRAGVIDYVVKPFDPALLVGKLQKVCAKKVG